MSPHEFDEWLAEIKRSTSSADQMDLAHKCPGSIKASQLTQRLTAMTCSEAASILAAVASPDDKIIALGFLVNTLTDANTPAGRTAILDAFLNFLYKNQADGIISAAPGYPCSGAPKGRFPNNPAAGASYSSSRY